VKFEGKLSGLIMCFAYSPYIT